MHAPVAQYQSQVVGTAYRPDIDGLRAVAVLSVMAYHYSAPFPWPLLPGGFTGVDVFFVISGFLITSKLRDDIVAGTFSILGFYDRRIRRILPALLVMLIATLFASKFLLMPGDYKALASSTAASAFGVSNFYFLGNTGYFDQAANLLPLLHTWSLAVEEQFYLVWPVLLLVIAKGRRRLDIAAILGGIVIIGFAASLLWFDADPKAAFFMALPRAWELAIGAALVFLRPLPRALGEIATLIGLTLIGAGFVLVSDASFPGAAALYPCLGAALVIWPRRTETATGSWLAFLSPIGLISYSLYLWHWPVWVLFRVYINNGQPRIREALALALISVALAALSYFFVEKPFRKRRWQPVQSVQAGLLACILIFCGSMYVNSKEGMPERISPDAFAMRSLDEMFKWPCLEVPISPGTPERCVFGAPWSGSAEKAILWGDSNAEHIAPLLEQDAKLAGVSVALYIRCAAFINDVAGYSDILSVQFGQPSRDYNEQCRRSYDALFKILEHDPAIRTIVLSASWNMTWALTAGPSGGGLAEAPLFAKSISDTVARLLKLGRRVVIVSTAPQWSHDPLPCALLEVGLARRPCIDDQRLLTRQYYEYQNAATLSAFRQIASVSPSVALIEPGAGLCKDTNCITSINNEFIYRDAAHFRRNLSERTIRGLAAITGIDRVFDPD